MELNGFDAPTGTYQLEMTFPRGRECLKERNPRLVIRKVDLDIYEDIGSLLSNVFHYLGAIGLACIPWALAIWLRTRFSKDIPLRLFPGIVPRSHLSLPRHRPLPLVTQLPSFGLIYGAVLWILAFLFMIVEGQDQYFGLLIELKTRDSVVWQKSPWRGLGSA